MNVITSPPRSVTEQLLLSTAADRALTNADFQIFADKKIYLDATYFDSYDSKYAIGSIRDALSRAGALLVEAATNSDVIIQARSGGLSIDGSDSLIGVPNLILPIPFSGPLPIPELALYKTQKQHYIAKIALLAYSTHPQRQIIQAVL